MCENILDFLQNIQDPTTIPNKSPIFEQPFSVLEQLGFIHQGYTNTNAISNYNLFEKTMVSLYINCQFVTILKKTQPLWKTCVF